MAAQEVRAQREIDKVLAQSPSELASGELFRLANHFEAQAQRASKLGHRYADTAARLRRLGNL